MDYQERERRASGEGATAIRRRRDRIQVAGMTRRQRFILFVAVWLGFGLLLLIGGCGPSGPAEADMAGCAVRGGGPALSSREVADCAADRAEIKRWREQVPKQ
jgi:hypothetical protein